MYMQFSGQIYMKKKKKTLKNKFFQDPDLGLEISWLICYVKKPGFENNVKNPLSNNITMIQFCFI
jgi:hypothetical protein